MKIKTRELEGAALDWAVIVAEHGKHYADNPRHIEHFKNIREGHPLHQQAHYSTNWAHGGPIIEREGIEINVRNWTPSPGCRLPGRYEWSARFCYVRQTDCKQFGPTPLIAAMRCYVGSKLGNEVDVPDCLL